MLIAIPRDGVLGRKHEPVPAAIEELAKDLLTRAAAVVDRGVDDVAARIGVRVEKLW